MSGALVCPSCDLAHGADERFCDDCGLPLVRADAPLEETPKSDAEVLGVRPALQPLYRRDGATELDPMRMAAALSGRPAVAADLRRMDLGTTREIAGMFVASAQRLEAATRGVEPVTDDRPLQEYSVRSRMTATPPAQAPR